MKINKYITITFVAITLFSCTQTKQNQKTDNKQISFSADFTEVKGAPIDNSNSKSIGIYGYYTEHTPWATASSTAQPNVLDNTPLLKDNGGWASPIILYWPSDATTKISFIAYAPHESPTNGISLSKDNTPGAKYSYIGIPTLNLEVLSDVMNQIDLLTSIPKTDLNKNNGTVNLEFTHELTKIGFTAFCRTPGTTMRSISISNLKYKGSMLLNGTHTWVVDTNKMDFALELNGLPISSISTTPTDISSPNNYFLMVPQDMTNSTDVKITVVYVEKGVQKTKSTNISENWGKSKSVSYKLDLGGSDTEELIITEVAIQDWTIDAPVNLETT